MSFPLSVCLSVCLWRGCGVSFPLSVCLSLEGLWCVVSPVCLSVCEGVVVCRFPCLNRQDPGQYYEAD